MIMTLQDLTNLAILGFLSGFVISSIIKAGRERVEKRRLEKEAQLKAIYGQPPITEPVQAPIYDIEYPESIQIRRGMTNNQVTQSAPILTKIKTVVNNDNMSCNQRITELKKMIK